MKKVNLKPTITLSVLLFLVASYQGCLKNGFEATSTSSENTNLPSTNPRLDQNNNDNPKIEETLPIDKIDQQEAFVEESDIFKKFLKGSDSIKKICSTPGQDMVRKTFCGVNPPQINGLVALQTALGLGPNDNRSFAITGHSTSLVTRFTNHLNPRSVILSQTQGVSTRSPNNSLVAIGFVRSHEKTVEVITKDPVKNELKFFLVVFEHTCDATKTCTNEDIYTPKIETNWTRFSIYEDLDLINTIADCTFCHQPDGTQSEKILRMQELVNPWNHWFRDNREGGIVLLDAYRAAHPNQVFSGIPSNNLRNADPERLQDLVQENSQLNETRNQRPTETFNSSVIENEVNNSSAGQPANNTVPGRSATWQQAYEKSIEGNDIPVPYHDVKVTNPAMEQEVSDKYAAYYNGNLAGALLPDPLDAFITNQDQMRDMGFMVKKGLDAIGILKNACKQCHNDKLDQNVSRAKFNVDKIDLMSKEEKQKAISRIMRTKEDLRLMPPRRFKELTPEEINILKLYLEK